MTRTIRFVVEYDGTNYVGWQRQQNGPSVQGQLEAAATNLFGAPVTIAGASRTDAGVHAQGQVAMLKIDARIPCHGLVAALNTRLPADIVVRDACDMPDDWHPRFSATGKHYRYLLWTREQRSPRWHTWSWHRKRPLDLARMAQAASYFEGEHDFAGFRAVGCVAKTTRRMMQQVTVHQHSETMDAVVVDVHGNAFLRNMVRIMVGTLVEVGEHRLAPEAIARALQSGRRTDCGQTAPACGLTLMQVRYDGLRGEVLAAQRHAAPATTP